MNEQFIVRVFKSSNIKQKENTRRVPILVYT